MKKVKEENETVISQDTLDDIADRVRRLVVDINTMPTKERTETIYHLEDALKNLRVGENDSIDSFVYVTKDLTQFKFFDENRNVNVNSKYVEKLADSIRLYGVISPTLVNEEFKIADGQRRILAVRTHGLGNPVPYIRKPGITIHEISDMNSRNIPWNYKDWLHRYEKDQVEEYEDYREYKKLGLEYEPYMRSRSLRGLFMLDRVDPLPSDTWERGLFRIKRETFDRSIQYLEFLKKVYLIGGKDNIFAKDRNFQKALHELWKTTKKIDNDRLLTKMKIYFNDLNIRTDFKTYKKIVGDIYNKRLAGDRQHMVIDESDFLDDENKKEVV